MRILLVHNKYRERGGEDQVFLAEEELLRQEGNDVAQYVVDNRDIPERGYARSAMSTLWSRDSFTRIRDAVRSHRAEVVHFHNTFPLVSPSAYHAAAQEGAAVVKTLHNYRLMCPAATLFRDGHVCEDCVGKPVAWPAVRHKCYRDSYAASGVVTTMLALHGGIGTWRNRVDAYIALTEFARDKFVEAGLPSEKIWVKPNFVHPDPKPGPGTGGYALYVGRMSAEKGVEFLVDAWGRGQPPLGLKLVGGGPLSDLIREKVRGNHSIEFLGRKDPSVVLDLMGRAAFLVFPSHWYEGMPRTIVEAFSKGTPVVATDLGAMSTMIRERETGVLFKPHDHADLMKKAADLCRSPRLLEAMRGFARKEYEASYSAASNYDQLMHIYRKAGARTGHAP